MELARRSGNDQPSGLTIAATSAVLAISYVAKLNGEDDHWLHELRISMFPEDDSCKSMALARTKSLPSPHPASLPETIVDDERAAGKHLNRFPRRNSLPPGCSPNANVSEPMSTRRSCGAYPTNSSCSV